ncbi:hypothetical protein IW262DRAFT_1278952 [Armillaria fumosa]|nr:hypothetical protein IW262DRAFT_1278952 [Armillaria fumosa]
MYTDVNGVMALMLWDSGSMCERVDSVSPHFAAVSQALIFNLIEPVTLQLGTVESQSKINFRTMVKMELAGLTLMEYIDVVNINWYNLLVGTPFMHQHGVVLDFECNCICINGVDIPAEVIPSVGKNHDTCHH